MSGYRASRRNVIYKNICVDTIQINKVKLYEALSIIFNEPLRVCCKNKIKGTAINPAKETDLPIDEISLIIKVSELIKNWNKTREAKEIPIE